MRVRNSRRMSVRKTRRMRVRNSRRMRGGAIIGSGMQGCVFSPKLIKHTLDNGKIIAQRSENSKKVSKVFFDEDTFKREVDMLYIISRITRGVGTVIFTEDDEPIYSANLLNNDTLTNLQSIAPNRSSMGCSGISQALNHGEKIYILNQPRIVGDIRGLTKKQPLNFFSDAYTALILLKKYNIIHTDVHDRNIFYNKDGALIGDFGHAKDLSKVTDVTGIPKKFLMENYDLIGFIRAITPYVINTAEEMETLVTAIESGNYIKFYEMAKIPIHSLGAEVSTYLSAISRPDDS